MVALSTKSITFCKLTSIPRIWFWIIFFKSFKPLLSATSSLRKSFWSSSSSTFLHSNRRGILKAPEAPFHRRQNSSKPSRPLSRLHSVKSWTWMASRLRNWSPLKNTQTFRIATSTETSFSSWWKLFSNILKKRARGSTNCRIRSSSLNRLKYLNLRRISSQPSKSFKR